MDMFCFGVPQLRARACVYKLLMISGLKSGSPKLVERMEIRSIKNLFATAGSTKSQGVSLFLSGGSHWTTVYVQETSLRTIVGLEQAG